MLTAARWLVVIALMVSIGLHTVVIQSAAWVGMAVTYSMEKGSVVEGLSDTFDGAHPCPLCHLAQQTEGSTDKKESAPSDLEIKLQLALAESSVFILPAPMPPDYAPFTGRAASHLPQLPATPPPRGGAGCVVA